MSKRKNTNEEPWSKRFGEDENFSNRQYSRSARHSKNNEVAPLYKVLLFLFLALLIIPFGTIYWSRNTRNTPEPKTPDQVMVNKQITSSIAGAEAEADTSLSEKESRRSKDEGAAVKPEETEVKEAESQESAAAESHSEVEASLEKPEAAESQVVEQPEEPAASVEVVEDEEETKPEETPEASTYTNTYTVKAGDNLYRISLNHGMTLDELKAANGLSNDTAEIGTVLKVK